MLDKNKHTRISVGEALEHPWFKKNDSIKQKRHSISEYQLSSRMNKNNI